MGELERFGDVIITNDLQPGRLAHSTVGVQCLIDDIPTFDAAFVTTNNLKNVFVQSVEQRLAINGLTFVVLENPGWCLPVPDERVANDDQLILFAKRHVTIAARKVVSVRARVNVLPLQLVLGSDRVELRLDDRQGTGIFLGKLAPVEGRADEKG